MSEAISQDRKRCQLLFRLMKNAMLYRAARAESGRFILVIRDTKGDAKAAEEATRNFEQEKVNLIYTTRTSLSQHKRLRGRVQQVQKSHPRFPATLEG